MATHSSILAWRMPWTRSLAGYSAEGHRESDTNEATWHAAHMHSDETRLGIPRIECKT